MKKLILVPVVVLLGLLGAGGVALAANVQCESDGICFGSRESDRISGTRADNQIRARQGDDVVSGLDGNDIIIGGTGADTLKGNGGSDTILAPGVKPVVFTEPPDKVVDSSDDMLYGGPQGDFIAGGFGQGGVDRVFGDAGDDQIVVSQRAARSAGLDTKITREVVDCGPGNDAVQYDDGIERINRQTCENLVPIGPNGQPTSDAADVRIKSLTEVLSQ